MRSGYAPHNEVIQDPDNLSEFTHRHRHRERHETRPALKAAQPPKAMMETTVEANHDRRPRKEALERPDRGSAPKACELRM